MNNYHLLTEEEYAARPISDYCKANRAALYTAYTEGLRSLSMEMQHTPQSKKLARKLHKARPRGTPYVRQSLKLQANMRVRGPNGELMGKVKNVDWELFQARRAEGTIRGRHRVTSKYAAEKLGLEILQPVAVS